MQYTFIFHILLLLLQLLVLPGDRVLLLLQLLNFPPQLLVDLLQLLVVVPVGCNCPLLTTRPVLVVCCFPESEQRKLYYQFFTFLVSCFLLVESDTLFLQQVINIHHGILSHIWGASDGQAPVLGRILDECPLALCPCQTYDFPAVPLKTVANFRWDLFDPDLRHGVQLGQGRGHFDFYFYFSALTQTQRF